MSGWKYDVFLSFRGEDTRHSFVDHLYRALEQHGVIVYKDESELHTGEEVHHLYTAIEKSRLLIVIFSKYYASSRWCLRELVKILSANNSKRELIPIFYNVNPEVVRKQTGSYAEAFAEHEISNKGEVPEWREALSVAANISGWDLNNMANGHEAKLIGSICTGIFKRLSDVPLHAGIPEPKSKSESNYHLPHCSRRRLAIFWDMENCCIPDSVRPEDVYGNILAFLRRQTETQWEVVTFAAYADISSQHIRESCGRAGMKLIDVPEGIKDASGQAIVVDMFLYALDNPPPASIMLISGDFSFSRALHALRQRRYPVILVVPSRVGVLPSSNAATNIWDWSNVVCGEGHVLTSRSQVKENSEDVNKQESIESGAVTMGNDGMSGLPGDLTGLKGQLVKLLDSFGGRIRLVCLASEYRKSFKKFLKVSDYKASNLVDLLEKVSDLRVEGRGQEKVVILNKRSTKPSMKMERTGSGKRLQSSDVFSEN